jgi:hypothetical protein
MSTSYIHTSLKMQSPLKMRRGLLPHQDSQAQLHAQLLGIGSVVDGAGRSPAPSTPNPLTQRRAESLERRAMAMEDSLCKTLSANQIEMLAILDM